MQRNSRPIDSISDDDRRTRKFSFYCGCGKPTKATFREANEERLACVDCDKAVSASILRRWIVGGAEAPSFEAAVREFEGDGHLVRARDDHCVCGVTIRNGMYISNPKTGRHGWIGNMCYNTIVKIWGGRRFGLKAMEEDGNYEIQIRSQRQRQPNRPPKDYGEYENDWSDGESFVQSDSDPIEFDTDEEFASSSEEEAERSEDDISDWSSDDSD